MKGWSFLMFLFLGTLWMLSPAWASKPLLEPLQGPTEAIELIDCSETKCPSYVEKEVKQKTIKGFVTCYTNIPELTDSDPNTTASGEKVRIGGLAANGYKFGTRIQIGQEIYTVNDRKHSRYGPEWFDIFVGDYKSAVACGIKEEEVIVYDQ